VLCHDATLIDLEAEGLWPMGTQLERTSTTLVIRPAASGSGAAVPACRRRLGAYDYGQCDGLLAGIVEVRQHRSSTGWRPQA
jgi:hypothetical protein